MGAEERYQDKIDEVEDFLKDRVEESNFAAMTEEVVIQDLSDEEFTEEQVKQILLHKGFSSYELDMKVWVPESEAGMFETKYDWVLKEKFIDRLILAFLIALFIPIAILLLIFAIPLAAITMIIGGPIYLVRHLLNRTKKED